MSRIFGEMKQIAFVVRDIDGAMKYWTKTLAIGPFFIKREIHLADFRYYGKPSDSPSISIALANSGAMQIGLIQQHDETPRIYRDLLLGGSPGLQHIAAWTTRAGLRKAQLLEGGAKLSQEGTIPSSGVRLAYFATDTEVGGVVFEIADLREPGQYQRVLGIAEAAKSWDGRNAVREVTT